MGEPATAAAFDPFDTSIQIDPFPHYARLRREGPVVRLDGAPEPTYAVCGYDAVLAALRDPATFSSRVAPVPILLCLDPPEHTRLRAAISGVFRPRALERLSGAIEERARRLWAEYLAAGGGDVVAGFAAPLPIAVIADLLGLPPEGHGLLRRGAEASIQALGAAMRGERPRPEDVAAFEALRVYLDGALAALREDPPEHAGGRLARLVNEDALTGEEALAFAQFLFVAGHETTMSLLASGADVLAREPALLERLGREPDLVARFVEEVLRLRSPLQRVFRVATRTTRLGGVGIPAGARVLLLLGAANRDPACFPDPDRFDLDRDASGHLAFGFGTHVCLGSPLARLEARIAFAVVARTTASLRPDPRAAALPITDGTLSEFGWRELPLRAVPRGAELRA